MLTVKLVGLLDEPPQATARLPLLLCSWAFNGAFQVGPWLPKSSKPDSLPSAPAPALPLVTWQPALIINWAWICPLTAACALLISRQTRPKTVPGRLRCFIGRYHWIQDDVQTGTCCSPAPDGRSAGPGTRDNAKIMELSKASFLLDRGCLD